MKMTVAVLALLGVSRAVMLNQNSKESAEVHEADEFAGVDGELDDFDKMMTSEE